MGRACTVALPSLATMSENWADEPPVTLTGSTRSVVFERVPTSSAIWARANSVGSFSLCTCTDTWRMPAGKSSGRTTVISTTPTSAGNSDSRAGVSVIHCGSRPNARTE